MAPLNIETVNSVHHWTDRLFSFKTSRESGFRFKNGHFTMVGLENNGKPLLRAYSIASANYEDELEFFSIKVPDGPLTSKLQSIQPGDSVFVGTKSTGTLVTDNLRDGKRLYLLSTGTGLAPFLSIIKDPEIYEGFDQIILVQGVRRIEDLAYSKEIQEDLPENEFFGDVIKEKLLYYPTVTREKFKNNGRITELMTSGKIFFDLKLPHPNIEDDRFMICGGPAMLKEAVKLLSDRGFSETRNGHIGEFVIERAFVE